MCQKSFRIEQESWGWAFASRCTGTHCAPHLLFLGRANEHQALQFRLYNFCTIYDCRDRYPWGTFLLYAIFDLIMATWVLFFVHETKGKSLERVNAELDHDEAALERKKLAVENEQMDDINLDDK